MNRLGYRIDVHNLRSMKSSLLLLALLSGALYGAPQRESLAMQEIRAHMDQIHTQVNRHQSELDLFQERLHALETLLKDFKNELTQAKRAQPIEKRLSALEKAQETLITDFKALKNHLTETGGAVAQCQTKLTHLDQQLSSDIQALKSSLHSMLTLLQKESGIELAASSRIYTVQPGDSLGQIALNHKTDVKTLKQLNQLSNDTIYTGQKLRLPELTSK